MDVHFRFLNWHIIVDKSRESNRAKQTERKQERNTHTHIGTYTGIKDWIQCYVYLRKCLS